MRLIFSSLAILVLAACAGAPSMMDADKAYAAQDYSTAFKAYSALAAKGDPVAERQLGLMYGHGQGVPRDYVQAAALFQQAADAGDLRAENMMGYHYEHGYGVIQSYEAALQWYRKAAGQGSSAAENNLGYAYLHGYGVTVDYAQAMHWFQKAAEQGESDATVNVGFMYLKGLGTKPDLALATHWFQMGAEHGNLQAQLFLAKCYTSGEFGFSRDAAKAQTYFAQAADDKILDAGAYRQALKDIIVAHSSYPQAAQGTGLAGSVRVGFDLQGHKAGNVAIVQPSGFPVLDAAARQVVMDSDFPVPLPEWNIDSHQEVDVKFFAPPAAATH